MDTKSSKCVHLVEGGTNGSQDVNMAPMGKTSLGRVVHARKRQKTSSTNLETHGDGSGYLACDTCSSGVPNEIVPAGIVPIGNVLVGKNIWFQTRTKGNAQWPLPTPCRYYFPRKVLMLAPENFYCGVPFLPVDIWQFVPNTASATSRPHRSRSGAGV